MRDPKTEHFLTAGNYKWRYVDKVDFSDIDMKASKENPYRLHKKIDEDRMLNYSIAMEDGSEFPAITLLTLDTAASAFKYLIATGVHRVEAAQLCGLTSFDAYVVAESEAYRRDALCGRMNTIEGKGVSTDEMIEQVLQLHEAYPDRPLAELAKEWHLKVDRVRNRHTEQKAVKRGLKLGHDFEHGKVKLTRGSMLALHTIHSDRVFDQAAKFAMQSGCPTSEIETLCREVKKHRDEQAALGVVEAAVKADIERKVQATARHGRLPQAPSTKFFAKCRGLHSLGAKGIDHLYLKAYPDKRIARVLCKETIDLLNRVIDALDHHARTDAVAAMKQPHHSGSVELH